MFRIQRSRTRYTTVKLRGETDYALRRLRRIINIVLRLNNQILSILQTKNRSDYKFLFRPLTPLSQDAEITGRGK